MVIIAATGNSWEEFWASVSVTQLVIWSGGILAVIGAAVKLYKPVRGLFKALDQFLTLADDITFIKAQLTTNGGKSVKDEIIKSVKLGNSNARAIGRLSRDVKLAAETAAEAKATAATTQQLLLGHIETLEQKSPST